MSVLRNIEFSILNTNLVKETEDSKKIKFKHESYLRIWKKYDSFCVETKEKMSKSHKGYIRFHFGRKSDIPRIFPLYHD